MRSRVSKGPNTASFLAAFDCVNHSRGEAIVGRQPRHRRIARGRRRDRLRSHPAPRPGGRGAWRAAAARALLAEHGSGRAARLRELADGARAAGAPPLAGDPDAGAAPANLTARSEAAAQAEAVPGAPRIWQREGSFAAAALSGAGIGAGGAAYSVAGDGPPLPRHRADGPRRRG